MKRREFIGFVGGAAASLHRREFISLVNVPNTLIGRADDVIE